MKNENTKMPLRVYNDDHHYDSLGKPVVDEMHNIRMETSKANVQAIIEAMEIFKNSKK